MPGPLFLSVKRRDGGLYILFPGIACMYVRTVGGTVTVQVILTFSTETFSPLYFVLPFPSHTFDYNSANSSHHYFIVIILLKRGLLLNERRAESDRKVSCQVRKKCVLTANLRQTGKPKAAVPNIPARVVRGG